MVSTSSFFTTCFPFSFFFFFFVFRDTTRKLHDSVLFVFILLFVSLTHEKSLSLSLKRMRMCGLTAPLIEKICSQNPATQRDELLKIQQ